MQAIKQLSKQIQDQNDNIARLDTEIERAEKKLEDAEGRDYGLSELAGRRRAALVEALQNGVKADTAAIDKEIAAAEKRRAGDAAATEKDRESLDLLQSARKQARNSLAALETERIEVVSAYLLAKYDEAQARYFDAIAALSGPVEQMVAIERAWLAAKLRRAFPAHGSKALADVRESGLRVTWDRSALRRPEVAAEYLDGYQECWFVPEWADPRNDGFGDEAAQSIAAELRSAGVDAVLASKPAPAAPEKMVEIEVVCGTIGGGESPKRDPRTGFMVAQKALSHGPGSRLVVGESEAKSYVKTGFARYAADLDAERDRIARERLTAGGFATVRDAYGAPVTR